ncbi:MAG: polysaccharide biosynthesis C-terminal domain-containing protein [Flavobacteriales bacterium]|nr:polysaccharide biosynthesis C-terminal domain-containing protein [Flavobacteriales bacterium]
MVGLGIGYVNLLLLFPLVFSSQELGLRSALLAIAAIYFQFSSLGVNKILLKFYPYFKSKKGEKNAFLSFSLLIALAGFLLLTLLFFVFKTWVVAKYGSELSLFVEYVDLVVVIAFLSLFTSVLETYLFSLHKTVLSQFLKTAFTKLLWMVEILMFHFGVIDINTFWILFACTYGVNLVVLLGYIFYLKEFNLTFKLPYRGRALRMMTRYGFFSVLSGAAQSWVSNIDRVMLISVGLSSLGVYSIGFALGALVIVPQNAMSRIIYPILSAEIKAKNWGEIEKLYKKSSLNLFLLGGIIFNCVWLNTDNMYAVLPEEYAAGKYVLLAIALCKLYDMLTGINGLILVLSKFYQFDSYASIGLIGLAIGSNFLLIPIYGINGAACATVITVLVYNTVKMVYVYHKFNIHPFTFNTIKALVVISLPMLVFGYLPALGGFMENEVMASIADAILRSGLICTLIIALIWIFKISDDINVTIASTFKKIGF